MLSRRPTNVGLSSVLEKSSGEVREWAELHG